MTERRSDADEIPTSNDGILRLTTRTWPSADRNVFKKKKKVYSCV